VTHVETLQITQCCQLTCIAPLRLVVLGQCEQKRPSMHVQLSFHFQEGVRQLPSFSHRLSHRVKETIKTTRQKRLICNKVLAKAIACFGSAEVRRKENMMGRMERRTSPRTWLQTLFCTAPAVPQVIQPEVSWLSWPYQFSLKGNVLTGGGLLLPIYIYNSSSHGCGLC